MRKKKGPESVYLAPNATVVGDVTLGDGCSVWYGAVLRGDNGAIRVGTGSNIQDNCVLHGAVTLGADCSVGHGALVHGCTIGDRCMVGMGAVILSGAKLGDDCLVGAGALVTGRMDAPSGSLLLGSPARIAGELTEAQRETIRQSVADYAVHTRQAMARRPALRRLFSRQGKKY